MNKGFFLTVIAVGTMALTAACSLEDQKAPELTGPSELGLSLVITAAPDLIAANGASQSRITVLARDANGQPAPNVELRVDTVDANGLIVETGTLSTRRIITGSNGQAFVDFTAPTERDFSADTNGTVKVRVLPVSTNFGSQRERFVTIRLVPPAVTIVVPGAPTPDFVFSPAQPRPIIDDVKFDASRSFDSDGFIVSYKWVWGDGQTETTIPAQTTHDYMGAGTYFVTLTVTDNSGLQASVTKKIIVQ